MAINTITKENAFGKPKDKDKGSPEGNYAFYKAKMEQEGKDNGKDTKTYKDYETKVKLYAGIMQTKAKPAGVLKAKGAK